MLVKNVSNGLTASMAPLMTRNAYVLSFLYSDKSDRKIWKTWENVKIKPLVYFDFSKVAG